MFAIFNPLYRTKPMSKNAFGVAKLSAAIFFAVFAALVISCVKQEEKLSNFDEFFEMKIGEKSFRVRLAVSDAEKSRGLMGVKSMDSDEGMLFAYPSPRGVSFWMKDTLIPLDIGFFDEKGRLTEVRSMYPMNLNSVASSRNDIKYCLEMNAGWFEKISIFPPQNLDMEMINSALKSRGGLPR